MKKLLVGLLVMIIAGMGYADILAAWEFTGFSGDELSAAGTMIGGMESSSLTRGSGINPDPNADRFNADNFLDSPGTLSDALSNDEYFTFTLLASGGYEFSLSSLSINVESSATGPDSWALFSSVDGFAATGDAIDDWVGVGDSSQTATLSGISGMQDVSGSIEFRVYGYGAIGAAGTGGFEGVGNDVQVDGTMAPIPEPGTLALLGLGLSGLIAARRRKS